MRIPVVWLVSIGRDDSTNHLADMCGALYIVCMIFCVSPLPDHIVTLNDFVTHRGSFHNGLALVGERGRRTKGHVPFQVLV